MRSARIAAGETAELRSMRILFIVMAGLVPAIHELGL
jgi:hypothetical protein